jgi:hypothetical protein
MKPINCLFRLSPELVSLGLDLGAVISERILYLEDYRIIASYDANLNPSIREFWVNQPYL